MIIYLIRHGLTKGNMEKRYIGKTDEPLCIEGISLLKYKSFPRPDIVFSSPMKRCTQTAEILFPESETITVPELCECDFGDFEGKNYTELSDDSRYQQWIDSRGKAAFPNGETPDHFRERCCTGFIQSINSYNSAIITAFTVHGGTIMAIMDRFAYPHKDYFDWHCENGGGYICRWNGEYLKVIERI